MERRLAVILAAERIAWGAGHSEVHDDKQKMSCGHGPPAKLGGRRKLINALAAVLLLGRHIGPKGYRRRARPK